MKYRSVVPVLLMVVVMNAGFSLAVITDVCIWNIGIDTTESEEIAATMRVLVYASFELVCS